MYILGKLKMYKIYFLVNPFYLLKKDLYKRLKINCMYLLFLIQFFYDVNNILNENVFLYKYIFRY